MTVQSTELTLCRLLGAWACGAAWEPAQTPDFAALYRAAKRYLLTAAACAALESTGLMAACPPDITKDFREAKAKSIRKTLLMDTERKKILALLEQNGIWYAPLKGAVINSIYPQYGTRQFADNDILFDASRRQDMRRIMKHLGFTEMYEVSANHDAYHKQPIYSFEMHRQLFAEDDNYGSVACAAYYAQVRQRLRKDVGNRYGYHFSDEDQYVYIIAHSYKHYHIAGAGLRMIWDIRLLRQNRSGLDESYIERELADLGLLDFARCCRSLADKLFDWPQRAGDLTQDEQDMFARLVSSGTYGTASQQVQSALRDLQQRKGLTEKQARLRYLREQLFPTMEWYRLHAPFAYRHRWALPFYWAYRFLHGMFINIRHNARLLKAICSPQADTAADRRP